MLASLIRFSIRYSGVIIFISCMLILYGAYRINNAGLDIFPEFSPKLVVLQTEARGFSTEQVEVLVTQPIENALMGMIGLDKIRSESIQGLSIVNVFFKEDTDVFRNRQLINERLMGINSQLPEGVGAVVPAPMASSSATVMTIGVQSDILDLIDLRTVVDSGLVPRLLSVPGVADVNIFGGHVKQLQIQIKPEKLKLYSIGIDEVLNSAKKASVIFGSGFIENSNQRITLSFDSKTIKPEDIGGIVLKQFTENTIYLEDVADIFYGPEPAIGAASIMGDSGIVMMIIGQFDANTLAVTNNIENVLKDYEVILTKQGIKLYSDLFRPANYIENSIKSIFGHLLVGGFFVVIIIFLFLFNVRTAFISVVAIPLSLMSAIIVLIEAGINLNIMIIGGLAIALGEVVDDAIIDTENIYRRLRLNRKLKNPEPLSKVVYDASMEVRGSVVYATFIVAAAFIPLLTLSGLAGRLFSPLGIAYILSIMMSLFVALTVTPALSYILLANDNLKSNEPPLLRFIQPIYSWVLRATCSMPILTLILSIVLCLFGISYLHDLGGSFLPKLREGHYIVHTTMQPGTALEESIRTGNNISEEIININGVRSISQWAGRAERSADSFGSHYSEFEVDLYTLSGQEQQKVLDEIREILISFPGLLFEAHNFLSERIFETISGYSSPVVINIYGNDLNTLDQKSKEIAETLRTIDGATDVQIRAVSGTPVMSIDVQEDELSQYGLRPLDVFEVVKTSYQGVVVGNYQEGALIRDINVILDESRNNINNLYSLPIKTNNGRIIELQDVAQIEQITGRYNILHQNAQRLQSVTSHVKDRDLISFIEEAEQKILDKINFDGVTSPEFTGAALERAKAKEELFVHSILVGAFILILILIAVGSIRHMFLIMLNLPFSMVGGVAAAVITGASLSVGSLVGFVTLFGITVRNSIMLISHYEHLIHVEEMSWNIETVIRGAQERLPSILMTALVTALAMLPIALDSDNPGREIMGPMAAIIIGGLISSTILNLLIMPSVMHKFGNFKSAQ